MKAFTGLITLLAMAAPAAAAGPHPTIRAMAGAHAADRLDPARTALLVIDFQNEYFTGKMPIPDGLAAMANARRLIAFADRARIPVYHVQHVAPAGAPLFAVDGDTAAFHPDMQPRPGDTVVRKATVSVFAGTDLAARLKRAGTETVIVAGLMTHACVAGAARDAVPNGFAVIVASDASATRDITRANGETVDHGSLHRAALAEIEDTFGDVLTTAQIEALPLRR
ncbi:cysteine hydrolase family protein [Vulcaniibacterium tengchongense]|uniref:Nicotinamidase-related amidase n=1 Tax=Vulcaniibacterium tengchongense TaxID=1273429 RepID=A0A3N4V7B8_9GAMM|nr:isochorismatase family protein [Vulcaniibacterium tengchongense]RPE77275.1 nicotinamidase-related amidase [Vulcaniibacterium tengchongense]